MRLVVRIVVRFVVRLGVRMVVRLGLRMVVRTRMVVQMGMIMVLRMEPIPAHMNPLCFDYQIWFGNSIIPMIPNNDHRGVVIVVI